MKEKITVLVKNPGEAPKIREIDNSLTQLQLIVDGYIEAVGFTDEIIIVCNEEGKLKGLSPNFYFRGDCIVGTVVFVASGEDGEFDSLDEYQIAEICKILW